MNEYEKRKAAILRHQKGEKVSKIVRSMGKTRQWFYNWIKRYESRTDEDTWFLDESRAPKNRPSKLDDKTEQKIMEIRNSFDEQRFSQKGAIAIQYEFRRLGLDVPPIWTINRVISRHGLNKAIPKQKQHREYPDLFTCTQQMDLVGPRYIKGDGRFYSLNMIDIETHYAFSKPMRVKSSQEIVRAIAEFWSSYQMPDALQMDNELAFRGSNRYPRSFGSVIRFALSEQVVPIFIPVKEPWRNGIIEKFNGTYQKRFLRTTTFASYNDLIDETKLFIEYHNASHRYSSQSHMTPKEAARVYSHGICYKGNAHEKEKIPLETGIVYFIRFIRSDLMLHLPTEHFKVDESLKYSYVVAEVNIDSQSLVIRQNDEIKQVFPYTTPVDW
jgi:transposase